ncbi:MAG: hypothetical protein WC525_10225, partial [Candidatus Thermoplasmatota archaeon]
MGNTMRFRDGVVISKDEEVRVDIVVDMVFLATVVNKFAIVALRLHDTSSISDIIAAIMELGPTRINPSIIPSQTIRHVVTGDDSPEAFYCVDGVWTFRTLRLPEYHWLTLDEIIDEMDRVDQVDGEPKTPSPTKDVAWRYRSPFFAGLVRPPSPHSP